MRVVFAAFLLSSSLVYAKGNPLFPYPMKIDKLANGLTVVRVPFPSPGLVAYYSAVRVGARNEVEADHTGFAHFFEHMMFRGTERFPGGARDKLVSTLGFDDNAFTMDDVTIYHLYGPSSGLAQLVDVEADRFRNLSYAEPAFQTESKAVLGEYNKGAANPDQKLEEVLAATAFTTHTYRHTTIGFEADIRRMPQYYEYSKKFFKRWYTPDNVTVFVVGDFDDDVLMKAVHAGYDSWSGTAAHVTIPAEPPQTSQRTARVDWSGPTLPRHVVAWHTPAATLTGKDAAIQEVLAAYLLGQTSPLYRSLILEQQLCESVFPGYFAHRDPSLFSMYAVLKDEKFRPQVQAAFDAAVTEVTAGRVDARRVTDIKSNLRYGLVMGLETADQVGVQLAVNTAIYGAPDALERHAESLNQVSPRDLVAFTKKYLLPKGRTVLTLAPVPPAPTPGATP
jgi:zinc protease